MTKLHKYYIFDITIAIIVFLIVGSIITIPPTFSKYFDNSITPQNLAGFLEKYDVNLTKINAGRDDKLKEKVKLEAIDPSNKNFSSVDSRSLVMLNSKIFNSTLVISHLENFQFSGNLSDSNVSNSYFTSSNLNKKVNLAKANLATANLYSTNLTNADLNSADLTDADLTHANLTNANLIFTDLEEAILIGADLTDAILLDTNLTNADMNHAKFNEHSSIVQV